MTDSNVIARVEARPYISHSTIGIGSFDLEGTGHGADHILSPQPGGAYLESSDSGFYPMVRLERLAGTPSDDDQTAWDYERVIPSVVVNGRLAVAALGSEVSCELSVPEGQYGLRIRCRGRDHTPVAELYEALEEELDDDEDYMHEDPLEHWLIQIWPQAKMPAA